MRFAPWALAVRFRSCATGATAIEYCMVASLMAIATITALHAFGSSMTRMYETIGSAVGGTH